MGVWVARLSFGYGYLRDCLAHQRKQMGIYWNRKFIITCSYREADISSIAFCCIIVDPHLIELGFEYIFCCFVCCPSKRLVSLQSPHPWPRQSVVNKSVTFYRLAQQLSPAQLLPVAALRLIRLFPYFKRKMILSTALNRQLISKIFSRSVRSG